MKPNSFYPFASSLLGSTLGLQQAIKGEQALQNAWKTAQQKANELISHLNLTEKSNIVTGALGPSTGGCIGNILPIERLNFSGICLQDGPNAMNRADLVSVFPSGITIASSWDRELIYKRGEALGKEFRGKGANVILGPVAGPLGRHALGGRNWEGFSPDPFLTGIAMSETIRGTQSTGVQACAKHFIGNEQETQRSNTFTTNGTEIDAISANIDDRTLHELYVWPFADSVRAGVASFMCSYNRLNQTYACENDYVLNHVLKEELGFEGYVMSDWFATHSGAKSINAGLDVNMPGALDQGSLQTGESYWGANITEYIKDGSVSEDRLDDMIKRVLTPYYYFEQDSPEFPSPDPSLLFTLAASVGRVVPDTGVKARDVRQDHADLIRRMGAESTVLLKNSNNTLPLKSPEIIAVFGNDAVEPIDGLMYSSDGFEFGTLDIGGGSGTASHVYIVSPLEAIKARAKEDGARVQYIINNQVLAADVFTGMWPMADVCLVFTKTFAAESWDRMSYEADYNSTLAVTNVANRCNNTVVITHSAGVNTMPWANHPNVKAILAAHLPGQESGNSIVDVLWGHVNPSGKLPYSIPKNESDYDIPIVNLTAEEVTAPDAWQADFTEGQFIDYRHFDKHDIEPLYEFGHGLSYTTFDVSETLEIATSATNSSRRATDSKSRQSELWEQILTVTSQVTNTGKIAGATVPQLYVSFPSSAPEGTPVQVLRGFDKVFLKAGETKDVKFAISRRDVSYWDVSLQDWEVVKGEFVFRVGLSSRDIRVEKKHTL